MIRAPKPSADQQEDSNNKKKTLQKFKISSDKRNIDFHKGFCSIVQKHRGKPQKDRACITVDAKA